MKACPYCAEKIQDAAVVCRFCKRDLPVTEVEPPSGDMALAKPPARRRGLGERIAIGVGIFFIILIGVPLVTMVLLNPESLGPSSQSQSPRSTASAGSRRGLTYANYQRIREGMTYSEVVEILGSKGKEISRSDIAGYSTVMYSWEKWGGANMNAMFQNGRLVNKAQYGLD